MTVEAIRLSFPSIHPKFRRRCRSLKLVNTRFVHLSICNKIAVWLKLKQRK